MSEIVENIKSVRNVERYFRSDLKKRRGRIVEQRPAALCFRKDMIIIQIHLFQLVGDVMLQNADRIQLPVFSLAAAFVDKKLKLRTAILFDFHGHSEQLNDFIAILFVDEALPARDDPAADQQFSGEHHFPISAFSADVFVLRGFKPEKGQLHLLHTDGFEKGNILFVPDDAIETRQLKALRDRVFGDFKVSLPAFFVMIAIVRFPQPTVIGDLIKIWRKEIDDKTVRALFHSPVWHMTEPAMKAAIRAAVHVHNQIQRFFFHSLFLHELLRFKKSEPLSYSVARQRCDGLAMPCRLKRINRHNAADGTARQKGI
ncbi:MAG: hypothetical protein IKQ92_12005 [Clostridia bacterium]|nr:hypothetical protein [Clostridia bacterium]